MRAFFLSLMGLTWLAATAPAAETTEYYDDELKRYLTLAKGDFGSTLVRVRFASDPGSANVWTGQGQIKDKELSFARQVGEGESPGTFFIAQVSESKVQISYKPQQKNPQDAGINGSYRRVNEGKGLQLAKAEYQSANERLQAALKNATKTWDRKDRPALDLWKSTWPALLMRAVALRTQPPGSAAPAPATGSPASNTSTNAAATPPKTAKDWLTAAQVTAQGYYFIETLPDAKTGLEWDGEYDDLGGGHVSLRLGKDGKLRASFSSTRIEGEEGSTLEGTALPEQIRTNHKGDLTAQFTLNADPEATNRQPPVQIRITKLGRYLLVETTNAQKAAGRGWFDGIYRGAPVPAEG